LLSDSKVLAAALTRRWYQNKPLWWLLPLTALYAAFSGLRRWLYKSRVMPSYAVGCPVVVVGNLTVGGTGKTPLVAWLARELTQRGYSVGVLSRGYGRHSRGFRWVEPQTHWRDVGDEPLLLQHHTACLTAVCEDRVLGAQQLVKRGANLIIADDGLQHLRLRRDCEIVVIDGVRSLGNGWLLPAGPLRERAQRLCSVTGIVSNGPLLKPLPGPAPWLMSLKLGEPVPVMPHARTGSRALVEFRNTPVHAVAGIGNPQRFFDTLRAAGIEVIEHAFADHHPYRASDLHFADSNPVLMTEKDAVKCREFADERLWYVPVSVQFEDEVARDLLQRVLDQLR
jgi:tetraacyldisaccharide 4'-kinase